MTMAKILFMGLPALILASGIPLALRIVPPNRFYGFRIAKTFASTEAWYQVNFATGLALIAAGIVGGLGALLLSEGIVALRPEARFTIGILITGLATLLFLIPVAVYSSKF